MKKQLLILTALFVAAIGYSQTFTENFITYNVTSSTTAATVEATDYNAAGGTWVSIPNSVTDTSVNPNVTYSVTTIGNFAFQNNNLTRITIPDSVTSIGENAFVANSQLACVISEAMVPPVIFTGGGTDSFGASYRSNINITIPTGTTSAYAAAEWTDFNSVAAGLTGDFVVDHVTYQFYSNPNEQNEVIITDYNTAGGAVVNIPSSVTRDCIDFSVTIIGNNAFSNNNLTSIIIPDSVTDIGIAAFLNNNLTSVTIPNSVITIGNGAFATNFSLANVVIGNNVATIGDAAFRDANFTNLTIPASVTSIGFATFADITELTDVTSLATTPPTIITGTNDTFTNSNVRSFINLHIPPNTSGVYATNTGALWTDFMSVTEDALLSTTNFELANDIKVITTTDTIKIIASNNIRLENYTVYSITGAKVTTGTETEIPTSALANGIYILKLDFDKGTVTKKVVVN